MTNAIERKDIICGDAVANEPTQGFIHVPIPTTMYNEFILRTGESIEVSQRIVSLVEDYLERTLGDPDIWSEDHFEEVSDEEVFKTIQKYGSSIDGYRWKTTLVPNGTKVRMKYKGQYYYAEICHQKFISDGEETSPATWSRNVASGTQRNAWRDLELQLPDDADWIAADEYRNLTNS